MARDLATEGHDVTLVTKDLPLRLKASVVGLLAEEYRNELAEDTTWTGFVTLDVDSGTIDELFDNRVIDLDEARQLPCHTGVALVSGSQSALGRVHADKQVHLIHTDRELFGVRGRSAEQRIALDLLADEEHRHRVDRRQRRHGQERAGAARPDSRRCSSSARTSGSRCSGRSMRWAARSSAICRAALTRRCRRGVWR